MQVYGNFWKKNDKIRIAVEDNETTEEIFLDISKAFDTIDHNIL